MCLRVEFRDGGSGRTGFVSQEGRQHTHTQTRGCFLGCDHVEFSLGWEQSQGLNGGLNPMFVFFSNNIQSSSRMVDLFDPRHRY